MSRALVVSVHDVAPATLAQTGRWTTALAHLPVRLTFLVVPGPWRGTSLAEHGGPLVEWLRTRERAGDEISVHGWCHRADVPGSWPRRSVGSVVARGAAEFWALDRSSAAERIERGLELLEGHQLHVVGTTPPGWLASRDAIRGMADCGLAYTTDHAGLLNLRSGRRWWAPALCNRPSDPLADSSFGERAGLAVLGRAWRLTAAGRPVRIGLHPDDLARPGMLELTVRAIERCLEAGAEATTYREVAAGVEARTSRERA